MVVTALIVENPKSLDISTSFNMKKLKEICAEHQDTRFANFLSEFLN
jgi:hypothetical protein